MSQSATPATRNEATKRWKPPKMTPPAELTIGKAIRSSHERLRTVAKTVADGCEQKRNVERTHPQPPDPQSETGTLATHLGKKRKVQQEEREREKERKEERRKERKKKKERKKERPNGKKLNERKKNEHVWCGKHRTENKI